MMACTIQEKDYIRSMLKDTIKMLVKHGLTYKNKFNIEGLLGITVDDGEVFLISVNELVREDETSQTVDSDVEYVDTKVDIQGCSPIISRPGQRARKRRRMNVSDGDRNDLSSGEDSRDSLSPHSNKQPTTNHMLSGGHQTSDCVTGSESFGDVPRLAKVKMEPEHDSWVSERNQIDIQQNESLEQESASFFSQTTDTMNKSAVLAFDNESYNPVELCVSTRTKGGRPMDVVWDYYKRHAHNGRVQALCRTCGNRVSAKAGRLREHLKKCVGITLPPPRSQTSMLMDMIMESGQRKQGPVDMVIDSSQTLQGPPDASLVIFPGNEPRVTTSGNSTNVIESGGGGRFQDTDGHYYMDRTKCDPGQEYQCTSTAEQFSHTNPVNNLQVISVNKMCKDLNSNPDESKIKEESAAISIIPDFTALQSN